MLITKIKHFYTHHANLENGVLVIAFLIAMGFLWNTMGTLQKNFELQQRVDDMNQEIEILQIETDLLEYEQQYFRSPEYIELSARERLGKAAPGEKVIMLPSVEPKVASATTVTPSKAQSNLAQWLYFFFGAK